MGAPNPLTFLPARKADLTFATARGDAKGSVLLPKQQDRFMELMKRDAVLLDVFGIDRLGVAEARLDFFGFQGKVIVPHTELTEIADADRSSPTRKKVDFNCKDYAGEYWLSWKMLRNNIMGPEMKAFAASEFAYAAGIQVEKYGMQNNTAHLDTDYQEFAGILQQCTNEVQNNGGAAQTINDTPFYNLKIHLMTVDSNSMYYKSNRNEMVYLMAEQDRAAYKKYCENTTVSEGYILRENNKEIMKYDGVEIVGSQAVPAGTMLLTAKDNVVWAVEEEMRYIWYDMPRRWASALLLWLSFDVKIKHVDGIVKCTDLSTPTAPTV